MASLAVWFVPVVLGGVFVFLFASANPLIERWISLISPGNAASYIGVGRMLFWIMALSVVWPFIHVLWRSKPKATSHLAEAAAREQELPRRPHRLVRCCNDPAFADPVQPAVCGSDHPRHDLSLGQRARCLTTSAMRPMRIKVPIPSLSRRYWRRDSFSPAMKPGGPAETIKGDPAAGLSLGRAERIAGGVIDPAPRSLCANLLAHLLARRGLYLDVACCHRAAAHRRPYCA